MATEKKGQNTQASKEYFDSCRNKSASDESNSPINIKIDQEGVNQALTPNQHVGDADNEDVRIFGGMDDTNFDPGSASLEEDNAIVEDESAEAQDVSNLQFSPANMRQATEEKNQQFSDNGQMSRIVAAAEINQTDTSIANLHNIMDQHQSVLLD